MRISRRLGVCLLALSGALTWAKVVGIDYSEPAAHLVALSASAKTAKGA